ncbi:hypothetical protein [Bradyrhizobium cenepequi]
MTRKFVPFEKTREKLIAQGLLEKETPHALTDAGHEHVRALIARINAHTSESDGTKDQYLKR